MSAVVNLLNFLQNTFTQFASHFLAFKLHGFVTLELPADLAEDISDSIEC